MVSNGVLENQIVDTVSFDNYGAGFLVAGHFEKRKYNTCGIINGPHENLESRLRSHGFKDAILRSETMELVWEFAGDFTFDAGITAFEEFLTLENKPRAIFACNDTMCHAFVKEAQIHDYTFPNDIAIAGFDDLPICTRHRPVISSVHTSYEQLGQTSINHLKIIRENNRDTKPVNNHGLFSLVPVSLKVRESS